MSNLTTATPLTSHHTNAESLMRGAIGLTMITITVFGFLYSALSTQINQAMFPEQASGSMIKQGERIIGSHLVAQPFNSAAYFAPRPSAADFNPMTQAGSNLARTNPVLRERIHASIDANAARYGVAPSAIPGDMVTQSGSGLDPDISPAAAAIQIPAIARARHLNEEPVRALVAALTLPPQWGLLGDARINVLDLNLALDTLSKAMMTGQDGQPTSSMK